MQAAVAVTVVIHKAKDVVLRNSVANLLKPEIFWYVRSAPLFTQVQTLVPEKILLCFL